jgi:hypothetical protein
MWKSQEHQGSMLHYAMYHHLGTGIMILRFASYALNLCGESMCGIVICCEQMSNRNLKLGLCFSYKHVLPCMTKMARFTPGQWQQTQLQANCVRKEADVALRASATMLIKYRTKQAKGKCP